MTTQDHKWMVEIGPSRVTVGPFDSAMAALNWKLACDNELLARRKFRSSEVRSEYHKGLFFHVDRQLGPAYVSDPRRVAADIEFYEEQIRLAPVVSFDRDHLRREFESLGV